MKLTNEQENRLLSFMTETFCFTDEQMAAIDYQIPMTQELFDSIWNRCFQIDEGAHDLLFRLIREYPEFLNESAKKIIEECEIE